MATLRLTKIEVTCHDLPHLCMYCGAESNFTKQKTFSWRPWWVSLDGLFSFAAIMLTKRMTVAVPLCQRHRWHFGGRILAILGGLFAWIGCIVLMLILANNLPGDIYGPSMAVIALSGVAWIVFAVLLTQTGIRPTEITDRHIILTRVSNKFIAALEEGRGAVEEEDDYDEEQYGRAPRR